ncbi:cytosolic carboxypeptidase-like protein 5 isoform 2 [Achlya hypogyna]|uniref:Cytosolic carboxypeptidase-like protein 5 n=1 Tax=Achlya hypogyna TaxID=1202772 RepID=A0A1V9ZUF7_ACHHY|nr:cytosolic carboxypeptidase-like protein 5 isoform 2 [Achlya hypogyna]
MAQNQVLLDGLLFSSAFDSGNLLRVEVDPAAHEYVITAAPDPSTGGAETPTTWFHFSIANLAPATPVTLRVVNLIRHVALYDQDMRPVVRALPSQRKWERIAHSVGINPADKQFSIVFSVSVPAAGDVLFVAFTYPYSYADLQRSLGRLDTDMAARPDIYYHRETLVHSVDGRRVDLLTISSTDNMLGDREAALPHLFPEHDAVTHPRPRAFQNKRTIVLTARVHPAETPASFVADGAIAFLVRDDPRARRLLQEFVFKIVPMLNPDGVARGHYRHDSFGLNLNRFYDAPSLERQPTIFAARALFLALCHGRCPPAVYIDLHAHAAKRGCFIYGNRLDSVDAQVATQLYPKLVGLNSAHFEYDQCTFSLENMHLVEKRDGGLSKQGCGRVALYNATKDMLPNTYFYTLECNYNTGRKPGRVPPTGTMPQRGGRPSGPLSPEVPARSYAPKYTPASWEDVGKGLMIALLDLYNINPCSRLPQSPWRTYSNLVQETRRQVAPGFAPGAEKPPRRKSNQEESAAPASKPRPSIFSSMPKTAPGSTRANASAMVLKKK